MAGAQRWIIAGFTLACVLWADPAQALGDVDRYVFVSSRAVPQVAVIDTETDAVVARIPLPGVPLQTVMSPRQGKLIASDSAADRVYIVDLGTLGVERVIETGFRPLLMQIDRNGTLLAIGDPGGGRILLVPLSGGETYAVQGPLGLSYMAFDRNAGRLFAVSRTSRSVTVVNLQSREIIAEMTTTDRSVGPGIEFFTTDPGGEYGFAAPGDDELIAVFDLTKLRQVASILVPGPARRIFPTADSQYIFVPNDRDRSVSRISTWTFKETARLPATSDVTGINFGFLQTVAFAISRGEHKALVYDLNRPQPTPVRSIALPGTPETGAISADGLKLYIALSDTGQVAVIDVARQRLATVIPDVGLQVWAVLSANSDSYCH